jgi:hypothetical protein
MIIERRIQSPQPSLAGPVGTPSIRCRPYPVVQDINGAQDHPVGTPFGPVPLPSQATTVPRAAGFRSRRRSQITSGKTMVSRQNLSRTRPVGASGHSQRNQSFVLGGTNMFYPIRRRRRNALVAVEIH